MKLLFVILIFVMAFSGCGQGSRQTGSHSEIVASINYNSSGCFHSYSSNIAIFKEGDKMTAVYTSEGTKHNIQLDQKKMAQYHRFISELRALEFSSGCTTVDFYSVRIGHEKIEKEDGSCSWNGFDELRKSFFK